MKETFLEQNLGKIIFFLGLIGILLSGAVFLYYWNVFGSGISNNHERWAQFGDYVSGTLGSAFALLALIALLITLRLQSKELKNSSIELRNSANALSAQSKSIEIQNFENRFFSMLSLHHQIVNSMDLRRRNAVIASGRDCLKIFYERLQADQLPAMRGDYDNYLEGINECYENFYETHGHEVGHYFRFIYRILKFVNDSSIEDKKEYSGVLRAQLSNPELGLLFYNGISKRGDKFKKLAEKYSIFENIELTTLLRYKNDCLFYDMEAFGDQSEKITTSS